jgi:hypothetical protein
VKQQARKIPIAVVTAVLKIRPLQGMSRRRAKQGWEREEQGVQAGKEDRATRFQLPINGIFP